MSYLRHRTVIHPRHLTAEDKRRLPLWGRAGLGLAVRLYEELAQHDGVVGMVPLREALHANTTAIQNALTALEEQQMVLVAVDGKFRHLTLKPVPEPPDTTTPRARGLFVVRHAGIDGTPVAAGFDHKELGRQMGQLNSDRVDTAIEVYASLVAAAKVVNYGELASHTSYQSIHRAISDLEGVGAIRQCGDALAVFPVVAMEITAGYDNETYERWLLSVEETVRQEASKPTGPKAQIDRLLDLYYSLCDAWEQPPGNAARNRTWAIKLINSYTFEELRPWLVAFLDRPEFFKERIGWAMDRYGMTLETFARNVAAIGDHCRDLQRGLRDSYWKRPLQREQLERFIA